MSKSDIKYWVGFSLISGLGRVKFGLLENYFKSMEAAWHASSSDLKQAGLDIGSVASITDTRDSISLDSEMIKTREFLRFKGWEHQWKPLHNQVNRLAIASTTIH